MIPIIPFKVNYFFLENGIFLRILLEKFMFKE